MKKKQGNNVIDLAERARVLRRKKAAAQAAAESEAERARAYYELAKQYLDGESKEYDPRQAMALLEVACGDGHTASTILLIELYIFGKHCPKDTDKALELLRVIVTENEPAAMYYLAYIYDKDPQLHDTYEAAYWYRRAAEYGHFKSQIRLASLYATGTGVPCCQQTAEAFLDVALESCSQQDPRFLLWQGQRLVSQPETEFVAQALIKAAAAMQYTPAQRLLLERGWRQ